MTHKILILAGDGIGPEIMAQARRCLEAVAPAHGLALEIETADLGGAAVDRHGDPLPASTLAAARAADAILLGAVGGPKWDGVARALRPETGLLRLRAELGLFANLRPARLFAELADASSLRREVIEGLDLLIVRELTGDLYFGQPRGIRTLANGERQGYNTMLYAESEIERIVRVGFEAARRRSRRLCSVDKANVLETSELWREVAMRVAGEFPDVTLTHQYVDNAAMQLVRDPRQFDVIVTGNIFGDILSDIAATLTGSIGLLPSASLDAAGKGLYEPIHGSAPDIAGQGVANPLAAILSAAMMLRYSFGAEGAAAALEQAVAQVLGAGLRTKDIWRGEGHCVGTVEMADAVLARLERHGA